MIVGEDRSANDGKIGIGADEIVREMLDEAEKLIERGRVYLHRLVLCREGDAMLVIVNVWRILKVPIRARHIEGNLTEVGSRCFRNRAGVAFVIVAKNALWVARLRHLLCGGDGLGVLLGLGEIDGDVDVAVLGVSRPLEILCNSVASYIVGVAGELVEVVGCRLGRGLIELLELGNNAGGAVNEHAHDLGVEEVAIDHRVTLDESCLYRVVEKIVEYLTKRSSLLSVIGSIIVKGEKMQNSARNVGAVEGVDKSAVDGAINKLGYGSVNVHRILSFHN